jgi:hypothetical protein
MRALSFRRLAAGVFRPVCACLVVLMAGFHLAGCGSAATPAGPTPVVLLDTSVTLVAGVNCSVGYAGAEFTGASGTTVAISATGAASLTPLFIVYAPDFATQLATSLPSGAGAASRTLTLTQSGLHHLSVCDVNGLAGTLRITVTQQK